MPVSSPPPLRLDAAQTAVVDHRDGVLLVLEAHHRDRPLTLRQPHTALQHWEQDLWEDQKNPIKLDLVWIYLQIWHVMPMTEE